MSNKPKRKISEDQRQRRQKIAGIALLLVFVIGGLWVYEYQRTNQTISDDDVTSMCFWNWATNLVSSEHIDTLHATLGGAGYEGYRLIASAYGEDKICQRGDEIVSTEFYMMDITPNITLTVDSETLADSTALGAHIRQIFIAIQANGSLPKIARIEIIFSDLTESVRWSARYDEVTTAIADEITDDDLYAMGVS